MRSLRRRRWAQNPLLPGRRVQTCPRPLSVVPVIDVGVVDAVVIVVDGDGDAEVFDADFLLTFFPLLSYLLFTRLREQRRAK